MVLFIASEVMFFVAWFWAYFNTAIFHNDVGVSSWPPNGITTLDEARTVVDSLPSNHSPLFAPVIEQTLPTGIAALTSAARTWLGSAPS